MPHKAYWLIERRVLVVEYSGTVDKVELSELNVELAAFLEDGDKPVHIISDNTRMERLNIDLKTFREAFTVMKDSRWGWTMLIGADPITKFFGQLVSHAFRLKLRMVNTFEQSLHALGVEDQDLIEALQSQSSRS